METKLQSAAGKAADNNQQESSRCRHTHTHLTHRGSNSWCVYCEVKGLISQFVGPDINFSLFMKNFESKVKREKKP